jgi:hypothetical protein
MLKSIIGQLPVTEKQAEYLHLESHQRISPALEECCLRWEQVSFAEECAGDR